MDTAGIGYRRRENCFTDVADVARAQALLDAQLKTNFASVLDGILAQASPAHAALFGPASACPVKAFGRHGIQRERIFAVKVFAWKNRLERRRFFLFVLQRPTWHQTKQ